MLALKEQHPEAGFDALLGACAEIIREQQREAAIVRLTGQCPELARYAAGAAEAVPLPQYRTPFSDDEEWAIINAELDNQRELIDYRERAQDAALAAVIGFVGSDEASLQVVRTVCGTQIHSAINAVIARAPQHRSTNRRTPIVLPTEDPKAPMAGPTTGNDCERGAPGLGIVAALLVRECPESDDDDDDDDGVDRTAARTSNASSGTQSTSPPQPKPAPQYYVYVLEGIGLVIATPERVATQPASAYTGGGSDPRTATVAQLFSGPYPSEAAARADMKTKLECGSGNWGNFAYIGGKIYWLQNEVKLSDCRVVR